MPELVRKAREKQPGLIVVDRAVEGPYQNYLTPENQVPGKLLPYPWESCIIMGGGWSYAFDAKYKTPHEVVHLLVDIVSKGGNLLLNIAPSPEGTWDEEAYATLKGVGEWMNINSDAIYNSRPLFPYQSGKICFTQNKNDKTIYATYFAEKDEAKMPEKILVEGISPGTEAKVFILGSKEKLNWKKVENGFEVEIPKSLQNKPPCINAWVIKVSNESL